MQIILKQDELEVAVRDYMIKCGITRSVGDISFTATRSGTSGIVTEVEITDAPIAQVTNIRQMQTYDSAPIAPLKATPIPEASVVEEPFGAEVDEDIESDVEADVDSSASLFS